MKPSDQSTWRHGWQWHSIRVPVRTSDSSWIAERHSRNILRRWYSRGRDLDDVSGLQVNSGIDPGLGWQDLEREILSSCR